MIHQSITLPKYGDWTVDVYYGVTHFDADEIMENLYNIGCPSEHAYTAYQNITNGDKNTGLTYSNYHNKQSVVVIGVADNPAEFINTLTHEQHHLTAHIGKTFGLDVMGEEICYLCGYIAQELFPTSKLFMCECKCCRDKIKGRVRHHTLPHNN